MLFTNMIKNLRRILLLFDSLGLALFTVVGIQVGITNGLHPAICIGLGTITACFGGVLRDISLNNIPLIFQKEIYATACIIGGLAYILLLETNIHIFPADVICIALIFLIRMLAVKYELGLPDIYKRQKGI